MNEDAESIMEYSDKDGAYEMAVRLYVWTRGRKASLFGGNYIKIGSGKNGRHKFLTADMKLMLHHNAITSIHTGVVIFSDHVKLFGNARLKDMVKKAKAEK